MIRVFVLAEGIDLQRIHVDTDFLHTGPSGQNSDLERRDHSIFIAGIIRCLRGTVDQILAADRRILNKLKVGEIHLLRQAIGDQAGAGNELKAFRDRQFNMHGAEEFDRAEGNGDGGNIACHIRLLVRGQSKDVIAGFDLFIHDIGVGLAVRADKRRRILGAAGFDAFRDVSSYHDRLVAFGTGKCCCRTYRITLLHVTGPGPGRFAPAVGVTALLEEIDLRKVCRIRQACRGYVIIREIGIAHFQIILIGLRRIRIAVIVAVIFEEPEQLHIISVMPDLAAVGTAALRIASHHSETVIAVGIQVVIAVLQPHAHRTALAGPELSGEFRDRFFIRCDRDLAVHDSGRNAFEFPGTVRFRRNDIHVSTVAVSDQVFLSAFQRIDQCVSDLHLFADCHVAARLMTAVRRRRGDHRRTCLDRCHNTVRNRRHRSITAAPGHGLVGRIRRKHGRGQRAGLAFRQRHRRRGKGHAGHRNGSGHLRVNVHLGRRGIRQTGRGYMVISEDTIAAFQIVLISLGRIGITIVALEEPEEILAVSLVVPILAVRRTAQRVHSETAVAVGIQILTAVFQTRAVGIAAAFQITGEDNRRKQGLRDRDRSVGSGGRNTLQFSRASGFDREQINASVIAVGDNVILAVFQRFRQHVTDGVDLLYRYITGSGKTAVDRRRRDHRGAFAHTGHDTVGNCCHSRSAGRPGDRSDRRVRRNDACC